MMGCCACSGSCCHFGPHLYCAAHGGAPSIIVTSAGTRFPEWAGLAPRCAHGVILDRPCAYCGRRDIFAAEIVRCDGCGKMVEARGDDWTRCDCGTETKLI